MAKGDRGCSCWPFLGRNNSKNTKSKAKDKNQGNPSNNAGGGF